MSGICSAHRSTTPAPGCAGCAACAVEPADVFPDWERKCAEAEAAGEHVCTGCKFKFYRTVRACPACNLERPA